jgi:CHAT domain-containing protein/predicted negative regulator of RcsB-dependent stress response
LPSTSHKRLFATLITLSFIFQKVCRLQEALELEKLRLEIVKLKPENETSAFFGNSQPRNMADVLTSIGSIYSEMGELSLALQTCLEAEKEFEKDVKLRADCGITGESEFDRLFVRTDVQANLYGHISHLYRKLGDKDKAEEYDRKAWTHANKKQTDEQRFEFLLGKANAYRKNREYNKALAILNQALELALKTSYSTVISRDISRVSVALGDTYAALELYRRALEFYNKSYELNRTSGHHGRMIDDCMNIGTVYESTGKNDDAIEIYQQAMRYCCIDYQPSKSSERFLNLWNFQGTKYLIIRKEEAWKILYRLGKIEKARHDPKAAEYLELAIKVIESLRGKVLPEDHRISFQGSVIEVYETMIELQLELWQKSKKLQFLEELFNYVERSKSRVLIEQLADSTVLQPNTVSRSLLDEENRLMREVEKLEGQLQKGQGNTVDLAEQFVSAQEQINIVWNKIEKEDPDAGAEYVSLRRATPISHDEISQIMAKKGNKSAIVEYYLTQEKLIILVLFSDKSEILCRIKEIPQNKIQKMAAGDFNSPPSPDFPMPDWQLDLSQLLIEPISNQIIPYKRICFIPHDVIHSLPLHALLLEGKPLIRNHVVSYTPSASALKFCQNKGSNKLESCVSFGVALKKDSSRLKKTIRDTAKGVANFFGTDVLSDYKVTKERVLKEISDKDVVHFSCHGYFSQKDPLSSGVVLYEKEILSAREIIDLKLKAELVTLGACETGVSERSLGDELVGLTRAFLYAGVPSLIVSLWEVNAKSTKELILEFYKLAKSGVDKATALQQAQNKIMEDFPHPYYWAPFVLVGKS